MSTHVWGYREKKCNTRRKGGAMNTMVANTTVKASIEKSNAEHLKYIDLEHSSWAKSLFRRMGLIKRVFTAMKPEIPENAKNEAKLLFQHQIISYVEQKVIPHHLFSISIEHHLSMPWLLTACYYLKDSSTWWLFKQAITGYIWHMAATFSPYATHLQGKEWKKPSTSEIFWFFFAKRKWKALHSDESLKLLGEIVIPYMEKEHQNI